MAETLAERLQCDSCAVLEKRRRTFFTIFLDMTFKRLPRIQPLQHNLSAYQHVIFLAPIWDFKIANPMQTLLKQQKDQIQNYSFITLCGHGREGQWEGIKNQLT